MKKILVIGLLFLIVACSKEKELGNMLVQGKIKGIKKGTLYLKKMRDTLIVSVDSIRLFGKDSFTLSDNITSPEMYFLTLDQNQSTLSFFGEEGNITVNDQIEKFGISPRIEGSNNQKILEKYKEVANKFQDKQLDLLAANMQAQIDSDIETSQSLRKQAEKQNLKKYIFTINFALNNSDTEAAAYITLTELVNANVKYLDSINNSLTKKVKQSYYGEKLAEFIKNIKETEK
ncbi:DUF4369 domain-containing protein [Flavobacteriaceae bacterium]|nr:DUF4369 domain-containing protein [Flavobacteriaceae bacterium]MDB2633506.1 DUF4369 domain-containing protein [Flavobacteriaceae bacterium]MDB2684725.1 DUF4369 domain-containing protein [Flavobacteriaceae bacterium]MDC0331112.1 DUF4369 domain-containing protein [Flavobacteriaceae bacterium]